MEGDFGTNKNHYGLGNIKMKGEKREKLMIFFGIMSANEVLIAKGRAAKKADPYNNQHKNYQKRNS